MGSYRQIYYQIVFATKFREPVISQEHDYEMYKYINKIIQEKNCKPYRINGVEDHIHIMCDLHPSVCLADLVKEIKVSSGNFMRESGKFPDFKHWQEGYGAFTYSIRERDMIINYIKNQKAHHYKENSYDELKRLLVENDVEFDERYFV